MKSDAPDSTLWVARFVQPRPHDLDALASALGEGVQRMVWQQKLDFDVNPNAPRTFLELVTCVTGRLVVYSEFSDNTIYGNPAWNRAQRACHDGIHLLLGAGFDLMSELRVARVQAHEMALITGDRLADFVYADLYASTLHLAKYGVFPDDQLGLVLSVMATGQIGRF